MKHLVLIGYMGCGKSTAGKLLSALLHMPFVDLDEKISENQGLSVAEIFAQKGETAFRQMEQEALSACLVEKQPLVLALGGGTVCRSAVWPILNRYAFTVYIKFSAAFLSKRLEQSRLKHPHQRPLIKDLDATDLKAFVNKHLAEREVYYAQATFTVNQVVDANERIKSIIRAYHDFLEA